MENKTADAEAIHNKGPTRGGGGGMATIERADAKRLYKTRGRQGGGTYGDNRERAEGKERGEERREEKERRGEERRGGEETRGEERTDKIATCTKIRIAIIQVWNCS